MEIKYPFKPETNKFLTPGQFWAIPLQNEKFACIIFQMDDLRESYIRSLDLCLNWS